MVTLNENHWTIHVADVTNIPRMSETILISFEQKKISKKTCEYLCSKLDEEYDENLITPVLLIELTVRRVKKSLLLHYGILEKLVT